MELPEAGSVGRVGPGADDVADVAGFIPVRPSSGRGGFASDVLIGGVQLRVGQRQPGIARQVRDGHLIATQVDGVMMMMMMMVVVVVMEVVVIIKRFRIAQQLALQAVDG